MFIKPKPKSRNECNNDEIFISTSDLYDRNTGLYKPYTTEIDDEDRELKFLYKETDFTKLDIPKSNWDKVPNWLIVISAVADIVLAFYIYFKHFSN